MSDALDPVHTIDDWYDGPRAGATEYRGQPHYYRSVYLENETWDPDEDRFELIPLTPAALARVLEADRLHQRWVDAQRAGTLPAEPDPDDLRVLPPDRDRWLALEAAREAYLASCHDQAFVVRGEFSFDSSAVQWSEPLAP